MHVIYTCQAKKCIENCKDCFKLCRMKTPKFELN